MTNLILISSLLIYSCQVAIQLAPGPLVSANPENDTEVWEERSTFLEPCGSGSLSCLSPDDVSIFGIDLGMNLRISASIVSLERR